MKQLSKLVLASAAAVGGFFVTANIASAATPESNGSVVVQPGDTLSAIGQQYGVSWESLASYNHIMDANLIFPNQVIAIPSGSTLTSDVTSSGSGSQTVSVNQTQSVSTSTESAPAVSAPAVSPSGVWGCIGAHESGNNPSTNTGNGYYGAFQFTPSTWAAAGGGPGLPSNYSYSDQLGVAQRVQEQQGWGAWPVSSAACGV